MIEKDNSHEKEAEERLRREIKEEIKREMKEEAKEKKGKSRKNAGVIISLVGATLYLVFGFLFLRNISMLIAGGISLTGGIVAMYKVKIGGVIVLIAIPIAIIFGIVFTINQPYGWMSILGLYPPIPHSVHVIPGGIICLTASDEK
ncbi:MAG: hypothetical protein ACFE8E_10630 [Candidatus Hodarchaeota archaeon]